MLLPKVQLPEKALFAFNTNIDSVKHITGSMVDEIGDDLPEELRPLGDAMARGCQREVRISDTTACWLEQVLGADYLLVGGQAGNAANTASSLGVNCLLHTNCKTKKLLSLFANQKNILIAEGSDFFPAAKISEAGKPAATHYILEFSRGDGINGRKIPHSNRFIASYDPFEMRLDADFSRAARGELKSLQKAFIGGFHLLRSADSLEHFTRELEVWKRANPELKIHLEMGEFQSTEVMERVAKEIFPLITSLGMDEHERRALKMPLSSLLKKAREIIIHSPKKALVKPGNLKSRNAARFASIVASFRARTGKLPTMPELESFAKKTKSLYAEKPKSTVGLGDTFASAYFMAR